MKKLFLVRHAKSSWADPGMRDFDRPLNRRGLAAAPFMAKLIVGRGVRPDLLVSSPANRALTTCRFFAEAFGIHAGEIFQEREIYDADVSDLKEIVGRLPDAAQTVFLFGHNFTLTYFANLFSKIEIDNVPTCGIVEIESSAERWADFSAKNSNVVATFFPRDFMDADD